MRHGLRGTPKNHTCYRKADRLFAVVYAALISQMEGKDTTMVLWDISFIRGCSQDKIRRKKIKWEKYAADQIWLPLNTVYKPFKRTESIYRSFRFGRHKRKWQACFQFLLHLSATGVVIRYLLHLSFFIAHRLSPYTLWQKVPPGCPVFWERSRNFPFHRWAPSSTCLFCGSPPRHGGWAGSTAAPGHGNRRHAHLWMVRLFPRPCIHTPKRRRKPQIKVSCLIEKSRVGYDERQTTAWMKMEISQAL